MRYLLILLAFTLTNCSRIQNSISVVRMDCGSEATWQGSYLRFVDVSGRDLESKELSIRSLEDDQEIAGNVTSKGCFIVNKTGLWMVRHKEKLEGLIVKTELNYQSGILQLQDVSKEILELKCPNPELGSLVNPDIFLTGKTSSDRRGYQMRMQVRSREVGQLKSLPWLNLAHASTTQINGIVNEGEAIVELELKNHFRLGEKSTKACPVRFDFTAAESIASVQQELPKEYKSRPFYTLSADDDLNFVSKDKDISYHEVCLKPRSDWNMGHLRDESTLSCETSQIVKVNENLVFPERQGFWQIQFRSVDASGNKSQWSPSTIILIQQDAKIQAIKAKASYIATMVEAKPVDGTANSIVSSLELHKMWQSLPTLFERDRLENIILLSMHRPWLRGTIRQDLFFQSTNSERLIQSVFLDQETKIISFLQNISNPDDRSRELRYYNMKTGQWTNLLKFKYDQLGGRNWFEISQSQKLFVFGFAPVGSIWVGRVNGDEIGVEEIKIEGNGEEEDSSIWYAGFGNNDRTLIVTTTNEKLIYNMADLKAPPTKEPNFLENEAYKISEDGRYVFWRDLETGIMTWMPINDPELPRIEFNVFDHISSTAGLKDFVPLAPDRYLMVYPHARTAPACVYSELFKDNEGIFRVRRLTEGAPCLDNSFHGPGSRRAIMNDNMDGISTLLFDNLSNFSRRITLPGGNTYADDVLDYAIPVSFAQSKTPKTLVYEWWNKEANRYELVFLERTEAGDYVESFKSNIDAGWGQKPLFLAEDVGMVGGFWAGSVSSRGYREDTKDFHAEVDRDGCNARSGAYLGKGRLVLGCINGKLQVLDITKPDLPIVDSIVPAKDGPAWSLRYDDINDLLIGGFGGVAGDLYIWPKADLSVEPSRREVFRSGAGILDVSKNGKFLAVGPSGREEMYLKVFDLQNLNSPPTILEGHSSYISKLTFFGKNSLLLSASDKGILKIWDAAHPDFPGVTLPMQKGGAVYALFGINEKNEFIVSNDWEEVYHYRLDTIVEIRQRSCDFLKPYFQENSPLTPEQKKLCGS